MKVLFLSSELWPVFNGGLGVSVYEFAKNLIKHGINLVVGIPKLNWRGNLRAKVIEAPIKPNYFVYFQNGEPVVDWESIQSIYAFNEALYQACLDEEPEIVHANDWMTVPAGLKFKKLGKKLVFHIHSTEFDRTNGRPRKWVFELEKKGMRAADLVIANSEFTKRQLIDKYEIPSKKIQVVYNGIDSKKFRQKLKKSLKFLGNKVVLFVGRLTIQKGVWFLINAAREAIGKDPTLKFVIVGDGPDKEYLINMVLKLGLENNILFLGRVDNENLLAAYQTCSIFVMPSVNEPFGIVALEAAASGRPVILSKTSGASEVIQHCFKIDYWDTHLLANRILELLNYEELRKTMVENSLREVKRLSWETSTKKLIKVYEGIM